MIQAFVDLHGWSLSNMMHLTLLLAAFKDIMYNSESDTKVGADFTLGVGTWPVNRLAALHLNRTTESVQDFD